MPCCLMIVAGMFPRLALVVMWIANYSGRAFDGVLWPLLGFFFMPFTTCAYAIGINENGGIHGWSLAVLIVAVIMDAGSHGGGAKRARVEYTKRIGR